MDDNEIEGGIGSEDVYRDKVELVLVSPSKSYSKLESILVSASSTLFVCLILSTNYLNHQLLP